MVESVKVTRQCWFGMRVSDQEPVSVVHFTVSWHMPTGYERKDKQTFDGMQLLDLPRGTVVMMCPVYTLPYDEHPGACTQGIVYLIRTYDAENDLEDVEARFCRKDDPHAGPDDTFMIDPLNDAGRNVFPLPIEEIVS